jgi:hypothetical protein
VLKVVAALLIAFVGSGMIVGPSQSTALAQEAAPDLADVVLENSLDPPGVRDPFNCTSGRGSRQFGNGGTTIVVNGGCGAADGFPGIGIDPRGLTLADGEVRVEARHLSGGDRMLAHIFIRLNNDGGFSAYSAQLSPYRGRAEIGASVKGQYKSLGQRSDLGGMLSPDEWTSFALRAQGPNLWMLVNDKVILSVTDASLDSGTVDVVVSRIGGPNAGDTTEVSAVLRNLRASALANGDVARAPTFKDPRQVVTASSVPCTQPTGLADDIKLNAPADGIDAKIAALAGAWEGAWGEGGNNPLPSRLYVESIDGSKATVVYAWGNNQGSTAGWNRMSADVDPDGKISWGPANRRFAFWSQGDDVAGTLDTPQFTSKITMHRCPQV